MANGQKESDGAVATAGPAGMPAVMVVSEKLANPAPLGLAAFGITTLTLNAFNAGIMDPGTEGLVWPLGLAFGGMAQFAAGMWEAKKNNTFGFTAFSAYGAFWIFLALTKILAGKGVIAPISPSGSTLFLVVWGIFTAYMFVPTLKISVMLQIVFGTLVILFFLLAIGQHNKTVLHIAGWEGMICAGTALYASFATLTNEVWGRDVFPLGTVKK